jgi:hypothetical protein
MGLQRWSRAQLQPIAFRHARRLPSQARELGVAECALEVRTSDRSLKPQVRKLVEAGGTYVLFLGRDCVENRRILPTWSLTPCYFGGLVEGFKNGRAVTLA